MQDHICPNLSLHIEGEKERERESVRNVCKSASPSLESGDLAELREERRVSFGLGYSEIREALFLVKVKSHTGQAKKTTVLL